MGSTNVGSQVLTYDYRQDVVSVGFNRLNYKLHPKGIYEGGSLSKVTNTSVSVFPMVCLYDYSSGTTGLTTRIQTYDSVTVTSVSPSAPYIVGTFAWIDTENNYMDFSAVDEAALTDNMIIFGRATFNGLTMNTTFDYSRATYSYAKRFGFFDNLPFYVKPNTSAGGGYSDRVTVSPGGPFFFNGKLVSVSTETNISITTGPTTGRRDIIYIDSSDNIVKKASGPNSAGAPLPIIQYDWLPIAVIHMPPSMSEVRGDYITYIHPNNYLSSQAIFRESSTTAGSIWVL